MIRVLHILWSGRSGGAERFVRDITIYADRRKFSHHVCFLAQGGRLADEMARNGVPVYYCGMKTGFSILSGTRLRKVINTVKPDIIHNHGRNYISNIHILFFPNIPKLYFEHGGDLVGDNPRKDEQFYRYFGRFYDMILVNSNFVKDRLLGLENKRLPVIKTFDIAIDTEQYNDSVDRRKVKLQLGIPEKNRVIGTVCRLVEQKGVDDFIKVASKINRLCDSCSFVVIGEGNKRFELERMADTCNLNVHFLGDRSDVPTLLKVFDIFLFTPKWEPFGIVVLEALAAKVPVLGFSVGGMKEIIQRCRAGLMIEQRDHNRLAEMAVKLLHDRILYSQISHTGYVHVKKFYDIRPSIKKLEREYITILEKRFHERTSCK